MSILFLSSSRAARSVSGSVMLLQIAQAALRAGESLVDVAQAAGFSSITLFSRRYYGHFGHWPTQDQRSAAQPAA